MELIFWILAAALVLGLGGWLVHRAAPRKPTITAAPLLTSASQPQDAPLKVRYVPSDIEWSGNTSGSMPLKTLTYKQYECLEDGRYGFRIVPVKPTDKGQVQPHKTRAHGLKTVTSLVQHGFLVREENNAYAITDHGLNALEVCNVRY